MTRPREIVELRRVHLDQMVEMREATQRLHVGIQPHRFDAGVSHRDIKRMLRAYLPPLIPFGNWRRGAIGWVSDRLHGYVLFERGSEAANTATLSRDFFHIADIAVDPDWRGHGIADALVAAVLERAKAAGTDDLIARVWGGNVASAALFERNGFSVELSLYARQLDREGRNGR